MDIYYPTILSYFILSKKPGGAGTEQLWNISWSDIDYVVRVCYNNSIGNMRIIHVR